MLVAGQVYHATYTVFGLDAQPSAVSLQITQPDGTLMSPAPTPGPWVADSTGRNFTASYDLALTDPGIWLVGPWVTQGPGTSRPAETVTCREFRSLISTAEAKAHLNITATTNDDELLRFMMAATELIEARGGFTLRKTFTDRVRRSDMAGIRLPRYPVLSVDSVTSIWAGGPSWVAADLVPDGAVGRVALKSRAWFYDGPWDVTYTVGRLEPLESHLHAGKELLRHLWETQRGSMPPSVLGSEEKYTTSFGMTFTYPRRVLEALGPQPFLVA